MKTTSTPPGRYYNATEVMDGTEVNLMESMLGEVSEVQSIDRRNVQPIVVPPQISGGMTRIKLVRNSSGGDLIPGYAGAFDLESEEGICGPVHEIGGYATSPQTFMYGLIDPFIKESVIPADALFNLILSGPAQFIAGENLEKGDFIVCGAGGKWFAVAADDTAGPVLEEQYAIKAMVLEDVDADARGWGYFFGNPYMC